MVFRAACCPTRIHGRTGLEVAAQELADLELTGDFLDLVPIGPGRGLAYPEPVWVAQTYLLATYGKPPLTFGSLENIYLGYNFPKTKEAPCATIVRQHGHHTKGAISRA